MVIQSIVRFLSSKHCPELTGKQIEFEFSDDATVEDAKRKIAEETGYPQERMHYIYGGLPHTDEVKLSDLNVTRESFALISFPHGGPHPPEKLMYPIWLRPQEELENKMCSIM